MIAWLKKYWISFLFCCFILAACFMSMEPLPSVSVNNFDKWVHLFIFFLLGGCIYFDNTIRFRYAVSYQRIVWGTFFLPVLYGGLIELGQEYITPFRTGDWIDFLWDVVGAFLAFAIALKINNRRKFKKK